MAAARRLARQARGRAPAYTEESACSVSAAETERVLNVLDETTGKLELAACLPLLVAGEGAALGQLMVQDEVQQVLAACQPGAEARSWPLLARQLIDPRHFPEVARTMLLLLAKPAVMALVRDRLHEVSPGAGRLLQQWRALRADTAATLSMSAAQQHTRERELQRAWVHDQQALLECESLERALEQQRRDLGLQLTGKNLLVRAHQSRVERLRRQGSDQARSIVNDSEMSMSLATKESEYRQEALRADVAELQRQLDDLLNEHLAQEKEVQLRRLKMEAQLVGWLQNYDSDVSERQAELEELAASNDRETRQLTALQEALARQTTKHRALMAEKQEGERMQLVAAVDRLARNHAARCIQRSWRAYKQRKALRRKGRKKKKGSGKRHQRQVQSDETVVEYSRSVSC